MQLALVSTEVSSARPAGGATPRAEGFEELLAAMTAAQIASIAGIATSANSMTRQPAEQTARQARLAQQTAEHRQNVADRAATRSADPGSAERGVVSPRHERIVAKKLEAGDHARVSDPKAPAADASAETRPEPTQSASLGRLIESRSAKSGASAEARVGRAESPKIDNQPAVQRPVANPPATAPAQSTPAPRVAADAVKAPSVAEALGRVLAGRSAEPAARVATAMPATAGGETGPQQARATGRGAEGAAPSKTPEGAERGDATRRADFARLIRSLKVRAGGKSSSAVIRLDPPELGRVRINVRMEEDLLSVRVEAATQKGRELLQSRIRELVNSLADHNIRVDRLEVVAVEDGTGPSSANTPQGGAAPMQGFSRSGGGEDRRSGRQERDDPASQAEEELVAALDARLDIRV